MCGQAHPGNDHPTEENQLAAEHRSDVIAGRVAERYRDRHPALSAVAVAVAAWAALIALLLPLGLVLTEVARLRRQVAAFDREVLAWVAEHRVDALTGVFRFLSTLADTWVVAGVLVLVLGALAWRRRWWQFTMLAVAPAVELAVFLTVTYLVARPRPDVALGMVPTTGSYPSGHAAMGVALYGALAIVVASLGTGAVARRVTPATAAAIAGGISVSRVYLGQHFVTDVIVGVALGVAALAAGVLAARAVAIRAWQEAHAPTPRRDISVGHRLGTAAVIGAVALLAWALIVEPRVVLTVQEEQADIPGLPSAWDGATVGVLADLQIGMWLDNVGMSRQAVEVLLERRPDVVLLLGDFVYGEDDTAQKVRTALDVVRPLPESGIHTIAVFGNHDYRAGAVDELHEGLRDMGVEILVNDHVELRRDGTGLYVVGLGSARADRAHPDRALADVPQDAARLVMMHNPTTFDRLPPGTAPLAVAGHTHGGQVRVPFTPEWSLLRLVQDQPVHVDGWIDGYGAPGNELFVNRGIGMSIVPLRFNCTPAVTLFTLRQRLPE